MTATAAAEATALAERDLVAIVELALQAGLRTAHQQRILEELCRGFDQSDPATRAFMHWEERAVGSWRWLPCERCGSAIAVETGRVLCTSCLVPRTRRYRSICLQPTVTGDPCHRCHDGRGSFE